MAESSGTTFDALVIGAGAGGMAAAARLNWHGYRTLLVETRDRVGGRASTVDIDGFRVNTGALIIETGGENGKLFDDMGVPMGTRLPKQPLVLRLGKRDVPIMNGTIGLAFRWLVAFCAMRFRTRKLHERVAVRKPMSLCERSLQNADSILSLISTSRADAGRRSSMAWLSPLCRRSPPTSESRDTSRMRAASQAAA